MTPEITHNPGAPTSCVRDDYRRTSTLLFADGKSGVYHMRGGICAPLTEIRDQACRAEGYVVLCGLDVRTGIVEVWEHRPFKRVSHLMHRAIVDGKPVEDGTLDEEGAMSFFLRAWSLYGCREWYWHEDGVWTDHMQRQARECQQLQPRPRFLDLVWPQGGTPERILIGYHATGKLVMSRSLRESIDARRVDNTRTGANALNEPLHALVCCLLGMSQHPWKARPERDVSVVRIGEDE